MVIYFYVFLYDPDCTPVGDLIIFREIYRREHLHQTFKARKPQMDWSYPVRNKKSSYMLGYSAEFSAASGHKRCSYWTRVELWSEQGVGEPRRTSCPFCCVCVMVCCLIDGYIFDTRMNIIWPFDQQLSAFFWHDVTRMSISSSKSRYFTFWAPEISMSHPHFLRTKYVYPQFFTDKTTKK